MINKEQKELLNKKLPDWAVKQHPSKTYLSVIDPMAVIDRLNEVFGVGSWHFETEPLPMIDKFAVVKGRFTVPKDDIVIEQYGGNDNKDAGDAYKGAATDALTKIASYLGIGASIYRGQGNTEPTPELSVEDAIHKLKVCTTLENLQTVWTGLPAHLKKDNEVEAKKDEMKRQLQNK